MKEKTKYKAFFETKGEKRGGQRKKDSEPIHTISFKVWFDFKGDNDRDTMFERLEMQRKIEADLQRKLYIWWIRETKKKFIIVVEYGSKVKDKISVKVELTQLNLQEEEIDKFIEGANKIVKGELV